MYRGSNISKEIRQQGSRYLIENALGLFFFMIYSIKCRSGGTVLISTEKNDEKILCK